MFTFCRVFLKIRLVFVERASAARRPTFPLQDLNCCRTMNRKNVEPDVSNGEVSERGRKRAERSAEQRKPAAVVSDPTSLTRRRWNSRCDTGAAIADPRPAIDRPGGQWAAGQVVPSRAAQ